MFLTMNGDVVVLGERILTNPEITKLPSRTILRNARFIFDNEKSIEHEWKPNIHVDCDQFFREMVFTFVLVLKRNDKKKYISKYILYYIIHLLYII